MVGGRRWVGVSASCCQRPRNRPLRQPIPCYERLLDADKKRRFREFGVLGHCRVGNDCGSTEIQITRPIPDIGACGPIVSCMAAIWTKGVPGLDQKRTCLRTGHSVLMSQHSFPLLCRFWSLSTWSEHRIVCKMPRHQSHKEILAWLECSLYIHKNRLSAI